MTARSDQPWVRLSLGWVDPGRSQVRAVDLWAEPSAGGDAATIVAHLDGRPAWATVPRGATAAEAAVALARAIRRRPGYMAVVGPDPGPGRATVLVRRVTEPEEARMLAGRRPLAETRPLPSGPAGRSRSGR